MSGSHQPFKPLFGGKVLVVGCSDKSTRGNLLREGQPSGPKLTTYARASAALEEYWQQRAAAGKQPTGANLPGGEAAVAHRTRQACWQDSVHLEQQPGMHVPQQANIADIEDKETIRTRGVSGYTGRQPPVHLSRPPAPAPDTSSWVAINAFDQPRPRVKGIPGYTGHQPQSPVKQRLGQAAASGEIQKPSSHQQEQHTDYTWPEDAAPEHGNKTGSSCSTCHYSSNLRCNSQLASGYVAAPGSVRGCTDAISNCQAGQHQQCSRGYALQQQPQQRAAAAEHYRPWSAVVSSEACSTPYSPRFFIDGVEVPPERMQLSSPPPAAATAPNNHALSTVGAPGSAGHGCCCCTTAGLGVNHVSGTAAAAAAAAQGNTIAGSSAYYAANSTVHLSTGRWHPPRSRATTYAASYTPIAGFGLLQLARNGKPAPYGATS